MSRVTLLISAVAICGIVWVPEVKSQGFIRPPADRYPWNTYTTAGPVQPEVMTTERTFVQPDPVFTKIPSTRPPARQEFVVVWDRLTRQRFWIPREQFYARFQGLLDQIDLPYSSGCAGGISCRRGPFADRYSVPQKLVDGSVEEMGNGDRSANFYQRFSENSEELQTEGSTNIGQVVAPPGNELSAFLNAGDSNRQGLGTDSYLNNPVIFNPLWFNYQTRRNWEQNVKDGSSLSSSTGGHQFHRQEHASSSPIGTGRWSSEQQQQQPQRVSPCVTLECKYAGPGRHVVVINHGPSTTKYRGSTAAKPTWKPIIYRTSTTSTIPETTTDTTQPIHISTTSTKGYDVTESTSMSSPESSSAQSSETPERAQTEQSTVTDIDYETATDSDRQ